ncbi:hypothetical protein Tco_0925530 [Tanacetum coccineum]|uniref:Uncharacterized protein n=1 Tax=Tanacetum coccineum TaxID=301880 RepID=A0ABQ5D750_9ASTR
MATAIALGIYLAYFPYEEGFQYLAMVLAVLVPVIILAIGVDLCLTGQIQMVRLNKIFCMEYVGALDSADKSREHVKVLGMVIGLRDGLLVLGMGLWSIRHGFDTSLLRKKWSSLFKQLRHWADILRSRVLTVGKTALPMKIFGTPFTVNPVKGAWLITVNFSSVEPQYPDM